ncbi:hypothetical protein ACV3PA_12245 [Exiguobacterium acetylicum]
MTNKYNQNKGDLKKGFSHNKKTFPELVWNGRKPESDYDNKVTRYGNMVDELYSFVEHDKKYFNVVFDFFSSVTEPYTNEKIKLRERYVYLLEVNHKRQGFSIDETRKRLLLFNKMLDLQKDEFKTFRGFFIEEFLNRKLSSRIGIFERVFSEEEIQIKNYSKKSEFSTKSDVDVIHISCTEPLTKSNAHRVGKIKKFTAYECKATIWPFLIKQVYCKYPPKKHVNKVIYMVELTNIVNEIYSDSERQLNIVGYKSLDEESLLDVENAIRKIKYEEHYKKNNKEFLRALYEIKKFYDNGILRLTGKQELQTLLYA